MMTSTFSMFSTLLTSLSLISSTTAATARTTRYWDCCKPSCAWKDKAKVSEPVRTCNKQDAWDYDANIGSACSGSDGAYTCSNNGPWAVNDNLAYGFAAAKLPGLGESNWCCACYQLTFTSTSIAGKQMIVQVTNTGADLHDNHFDLAIPGGGVGYFPQGCAKQFNGAYMGATYGGYNSRSECDNLPKGMFRDGCYFRFDWFQNADNPAAEFKEVSCPQAMIDRTACGRWS